MTTRVLIVEDEPLIAESHREYLSRLGGFEVVAHARGGQEAMRALAGAAESGAPVDLVLLDLGLPDARGVDLAAAMSGVQPVPDIIAITAQRDLATVRSAMSQAIRQTWNISARNAPLDTDRKQAKVVIAARKPRPIAPISLRQATNMPHSVTEQNSP